VQLEQLEEQEQQERLEEQEQLVQPEQLVQGERLERLERHQPILQKFLILVEIMQGFNVWQGRLERFPIWCLMSMLRMEV
jgi:hypothetical protein